MVHILSRRFAVVLVHMVVRKQLGASVIFLGLHSDGVGRSESSSASLFVRCIRSQGYVRPQIIIGSSRAVSHFLSVRTPSAFSDYPFHPLYLTTFRTWEPSR
jgi:hypothetical protein